VTVTNAKGQTKLTTKNAQGQVAQVTDHLGSTITYTYDAVGNLLQTNAAGSITSMVYDQRDRKIGMNDPAMGAWLYNYNAQGELVYQRDSLNQSSTMAYDVLGRMTSRTEPDLVSNWYYDAKADTSGCGLGVGKLCQATTTAGYNRVHTYDSQGRLSNTATVLASAGTSYGVGAAYDANTGRQSSKTWPSGLQSTYSYTTLGYLSSVASVVNTDFPKQVKYDVLAMNARGQVTQYRYGDQAGTQVTTVDTRNPTSNRLTARVATTDGAASGNVYSQSYQYDALSNLSTRADNVSGVQETFSYDALNRLTMYTAQGGGVSPIKSTQVIYDARGNIQYKSDVGRYWYDAARPNRMTNVTLETHPQATVSLSATRALSYVFDDYRSSAQSVNSVSVGNGNLEYTAMLDTRAIPASTCPASSAMAT
jgi:YD repeat-containing protein